MKKLMIIVIITMAIILPVKLYANQGNITVNETVTDEPVKHRVTIKGIYFNFNQEKYEVYIEYSEASQYYIEVNNLEEYAPGALVIDSISTKNSGSIIINELQLINPNNGNRYRLLSCSPTSSVEKESYSLTSEDNNNVSFDFDIDGIYVLDER